jgi:hypothetical protein
MSLALVPRADLFPLIHSSAVCTKPNVAVDTVDGNARLARKHYP